ncbi:MAG: hypothetical protein CV089_02915 [Nitrospira sp. WS110]|nr:hypothetical protein [Nitrospira sp. WS110]
MKTMLMAVLAVAVAVTFSAPSFAGEGKKKKEGDHVVVYSEKKEQQKGKADDTFAGEDGKKKGGKADETFAEGGKKPGK